MKACLTLFFIVTIYHSFGSTAKLDSTVVSLFEIAKNQVETGDYQAANQTFLELLSPKKLMPDDLTYFFGKSLYHSGGYNRIAKDFLNKYLSLKGDSSEYYQEAVAMLKSMGQKFVEPIDTSDDRTTEQKQLDKCGDSDDAICPICNGSNVLSSNGAFGATFRECNYCDERGLMPCKNYTKYVQEGVLLEYKKE